MSDLLSSLLDSTLDDLSDLPAFATFVPGAHRVTINWEEKKIGDHPAVELKLKLVETLELADASSAPNEVGTETNMAFMLDNEFGQGKLKEVLKPLGAALGVSNLREIIEQSKGMEVTVVTKLRADKSDPDKKYMDIKSLIVG